MSVRIYEDCQPAKSGSDQYRHWVVDKNGTFVVPLERVKHAKDDHFPWCVVEGWEAPSFLAGRHFTDSDVRGKTLYSWHLFPTYVMALKAAVRLAADHVRKCKEGVEQAEESLKKAIQNHKDLSLQFKCKEVLP